LNAYIYGSQEFAKLFEQPSYSAILGPCTALFTFNTALSDDGYNNNELRQTGILSLSQFCRWSEIVSEMQNYEYCPQPFTFTSQLSMVSNAHRR